MMTNKSNVTKFKTPISSNMSVEQVKKRIISEDWSNLLVVGYHKDTGCDLITRSSEMSKQDALWLLESAKLHVFGL